MSQSQVPKQNRSSFRIHYSYSLYGREGRTWLDIARLIFNQQINMSDQYKKGIKIENENLQIIK